MYLLEVLILLIAIACVTKILLDKIEVAIDKRATKKHKKERELKDYYNNCIKNKENELKNKQKDIEYQYNILYQTELSQLQIEKYS